MRLEQAPFAPPAMAIGKDQARPFESAAPAFRTAIPRRRQACAVDRVGDRDISSVTSN
jgi:hypothetical protein